MKFKRFISVFLLCTCLTGLFLTPAAEALEVPDIQAKAALLADVNTDAVAYAKNIHEKNYPASLTKVMTALLILEKVSGNETLLNQEVTASESAFSDTYYHADGSSAGIKAGEIMTVKQLLQCMLIVSANEACNILAEWDAGSIAAFVDAMNAKAKALGCENTHFVNPSGLHDPDHYTSAWDLYLITKAAMQYPEFMEICDSAKAVIPATNLGSKLAMPLILIGLLISSFGDLSYALVYLGHAGDPVGGKHLRGGLGSGEAPAGILLRVTLEGAVDIGTGPQRQDHAGQDQDDIGPVKAVIVGHKTTP